MGQIKLRLNGVLRSSRLEWLPSIERWAIWQMLLLSHACYRCSVEHLSFRRKGKGGEKE
jgi:hypothetical protein